MECFDHPVSISDCGKWMRGRTIEFSDTTPAADDHMVGELDPDELAADCKHAALGLHLEFVG